MFTRSTGIRSNLTYQRKARYGVMASLRVKPGLTTTNQYLLRPRCFKTLFQQNLRGEFESKQIQSVQWCKLRKTRAMPTQNARTTRLQISRWIRWKSRKSRGVIYGTNDSLYPVNVQDVCVGVFPRFTSPNHRCVYALKSYWNPSKNRFRSNISAILLVIVKINEFRNIREGRFWTS